MTAFFLQRALLAFAFLAVLSVCPSLAVAQDLDDVDETHVINLRNAAIATLAENVSGITERTLVLGPAVDGSVTVISARPLTQAGVWSLFQSILRARGFVAVQSGAIWEIVTEAEARARGPIVDETGRSGEQDVVTRLIPLARLPSDEAVRVLRPLVAAEGYIEALADPNAIIITDTQANVDRILAIAKSFDGPDDLRTVVVRFSFADAQAVADAMAEVLGDVGTGARISVDAGSNVLLVRGTPQDIEQIQSLARELDVAPRVNPQSLLRTQFFELRFADAEAVAKIVANTLRAAGPSATFDPENPEGTDPAVARLPADGDVDPVSVQASTETNSVVVRGTLRQIEEATGLILALDQQRAQVMIEAAIVEVSSDVGEALGVQLGLNSQIPDGSLAATSFDNAGQSLNDVIRTLGVSQGVGLASGLTIGGARDNFGLLIQALSQSTRANLLSTPSVTTTDNKPATILVGQNVPFRTGGFETNAGTLVPFTTIERRDVGINMRVLPRVTSNGIVRMDITQEVSSLVNANVAGAADIITNRRLIETTVQARNGGMIVLGGLITDDRQSIDGKVPGISKIPVLGELFKSRNRSQTRRMLYVFMRVTVITSQEAASAVAQRQYQRLRNADAAEPPRSLLNEKRVRKLPLEIQGLY